MAEVSLHGAEDGPPEGGPPEGRPPEGGRSTNLHPPDLLDPERIRSRVGAGVLRRIARLDVFAELDSTNSHLLGAPAPTPGNLTAALSEFQHTGRGRRGRTWNMPPGSGIALSVGWSFANTPRDLPALSLAAGVVTRQVVEALTGCAPALKWPNDLVWNRRKLGGILVETAPRNAGACHVVVGIGLNVSMDSETLGNVGEHPGSVIDLEGMANARPPPRNELAAGLIAGCFEMFTTFEKSGFRPYLAPFREADCLRGRPVTVTDGPDCLSGMAEGVDARGALIVTTADGARRIISGDVTARPDR